MQYGMGQLEAARVSGAVATNASQSCHHNQDMQDIVGGWHALA